MKRLLSFSAVALASLLLAPHLSDAKGPPEHAGKHEVGITGGGQVENNNTGIMEDGVLLEFISKGGFTAKSVGPAYYDNGNPIWHAKGQIQAKNVLADDPSRNYSSLHGRVVCIAHRKSDYAWEIRFEITKSGGENPLPTEVAVLDEYYPTYGSLFVRDNGKSDYADENFDPESLINPACNQDLGFDLEPFIHGNVNVRY